MKTESWKLYFRSFLQTLADFGPPVFGHYWHEFTQDVSILFFTFPYKPVVISGECSAFQSWWFSHRFKQLRWTLQNMGHCFRFLILFIHHFILSQNTEVSKKLDLSGFQTHQKSLVFKWPISDKRYYPKPFYLEKEKNVQFSDEVLKPKQKTLLWL